VLVAASLFPLAWPALWWLPAALDAALLVLIAVEIWFTPSPAGLGLERRVPARAGLSAAFEREITLTPVTPLTLRVEVREAFPASFEVLERTLAGGRAAPASGDASGGPDEVRLDGMRPVRVVRGYRGQLRGKHALGAVRLRVTGPLGLMVRQSRLVGSQAVAIEPPLANLSTTLRLAASDRWRDLGVHVRRRRGGMTEFESLREYVHGDDVRSVDWKGFAKRGHPVVRQFQVERGQELLLLVDSGRRMGATTALASGRGWTKLDYALECALAIAAVALQKGDRVGVGVFDSLARAYVPPRRGERQMARLREAVFDRLPSKLDSDLGRALREAAVRLRRRALVLVLSDVADPLSVERQKRALSRGVHNHRVLFCALDDPGLREAALGGEGIGVALQASSLQQIEERTRALRSLSASGVRVLNALPAEAAGPFLAAWLDERRRGA
jgi:uncharacterized protein (DUF58 family)